MLKDVASERAVLSGLLNFGKDVFFDVDDILTSNCFTTEINQIIYSCIKRILDRNPDAEIDIPLILSSANELKLDAELKKPENKKYLFALKDFPVKPENIRDFAGRVRKLRIVSQLLYQLELAKTDLLSITGAETLESIMSIPENYLFNFNSKLGEVESAVKRLGERASEYVDYLANNPTENIGISSGIPSWDKAIGGGFRRKTVSLVGARTKVGKSLLSLSVAIFIAKTLRIPVLYLDTEMSTEDQMARAIANLSSVAIDSLEKGSFTKNPFHKRKVFDAAKLLSEIPIFYKNVSGESIDDSLASVRRWLKTEVKNDPFGRLNNCLVIYDYIKLMTQESLNGLAEWQYLGLLMTKLHNFTVHYDLPILGLVQLNRDGIDNNSTGSVSGSDRQVWLASNFSILRRKTDEEIASDKSGNYKILILAARHGAGLAPNEYINLSFKGHFSRIEEAKVEDLGIKHDNIDDAPAF